MIINANTMKKMGILPCGLFSALYGGRSGCGCGILRSCSRGDDGYMRALYFYPHQSAPEDR